MEKFHKLVFVSLLFSLITARSFGQSHDTNENEKFIGKWSLEKAELMETQLSRPEKTTLATYTSSQPDDSPSLLNLNIFEFELTVEPERHLLISVPQKTLKDAVLVLDAFTHTFTFYDSAEENQQFSYNYEFMTDNQLLLRTREVFYNNTKGLPVKAVLNIYLKKE